jgi:DNA-binding NarL/FixJ family response regulator
VARIRAVLVTTPALLSDLIVSLAPERMNLDVIAEFSQRDGLLSNLQFLHPDLVVIGLRATETDDVVRSLYEGLPATKFVALSADGRGVFGYHGGTQPIDLSDASPQALINFLRGSSEQEV